MRKRVKCWFFIHVLRIPRPIAEHFTWDRIEDSR